MLFDPHGVSLPDGLLGLRANFVARRWGAPSGDGGGAPKGVSTDAQPQLQQPCRRGHLGSQLAPFALAPRALTGDWGWRGGGGEDDNVGGGGGGELAPLDGTLFRLQLRTAAQAASSRLSPRAWWRPGDDDAAASSGGSGGAIDDELGSMLAAFAASAAELLLFLQVRRCRLENSRVRRALGARALVP